MSGSPRSCGRRVPTNLKGSREIIAGSGQGRACELTGRGTVARVAEFFISVLAIR
jgi:hypothetical protein